MRIFLILTPINEFFLRNENIEKLLFKQVYRIFNEFQINNLLFNIQCIIYYFFEKEITIRIVLMIFYKYETNNVTFF